MKRSYLYGRVMFATVASLCFLSLLVSLSARADSEILKTIIVIADTDNPLSQKTITDLQLRLSETRLVWKLNDYKKIDRQSLSTTGQGAALLLTIGTPAARAILDFNLSTPVLQILVSRAVADYVRDNVKSSANNRVNAIYLDQPAGRIFRFIAHSMTNTNKVAMLFGKGTLRYQSEFVNEAKENRIVLVRNEFDASAPSRSLQSLVDNNVPILVIPDSDVYTPVNTKWLLYMAYREQLPVFGFSSSFVDAGGVGAVFSVPDDIMKQTAEVLMSWNKEGERALPGNLFPKYFDVRYNEAVANGLRIEMPPAGVVKTLLEKAEATR